MIVRTDSAEGRGRVTVDASISFRDFLSERGFQRAKLESGLLLDSCCAESMETLGIKAGHVIRLLDPVSSTRTASIKFSVKQQDLDSLLDEASGLISRPRDPHFCTHAQNAMCDYCMPLEPYDSSYLSSRKIKVYLHMIYSISRGTHT